MRRARVLVADSLPLFRAGVRNLLRRESDLEVLEATGSDDAAALLAGGHAEIALIDLDLPPTGGIDLVRQVRSHTRAAMIVWSLEPSRDAVLESIAAGAHGFLHKEISPTGLVRALRGTVNGEAPLTRDMAALMIDAIHTLQARSKALKRAAVLSEREKEVLAHVARGARNREIAEELAISEFTVKRHMQNILQKLDVPSRRAAAAFYVSAYRDDEAAEERSA
jgi:two-component system, NarL family, nitrate/nitrite response regulator NarL